MIRRFYILLLLSLPMTGFSQGSILSPEEKEGRVKYWIFLVDKGNLENSGDPVLSEKAIQRRDARQIPIDIRDYPLNQKYLEQLVQSGGIYLRSSKWLNAVSAWLSPEELISVREWSFVKSVKPILPVKLDLSPIPQQSFDKTNYEGGYAANQTEMIGLNKLHRVGLSGKGVLIAVMDIGFRNVNINQGFDHLFMEDRIKYTWDFVDDEADVYDNGNHGAWVLSILAGFYPEEYIGSAPGADYLLFATENGGSETHQEEDNWVRAMEVADSLGADIFSTSLGYNVFNAGEGDYTYEDMCGDSAIITIAADIAASRGILVVNSAGNEGGGAWRHITAPADGDSVLAVGAVDATRFIEEFSSQGPTFDGRIKPDVCAQGSAVAYLTIEGNIGSGGGTSFSCPIISGFAACLLQSSPGYPNMELYNAIIQSADRYTNPDTFYGYGIPDAEIAYQIIHGTAMPTFNEFHLEEFTVAPNPSQGNFEIFMGELDYEFDAQIDLFDSQGRLIWSDSKHMFPFYIGDPIAVDAAEKGLAHGMYIVRIRDVAADATIFTGRVIITNL